MTRVVFDSLGTATGPASSGGWENSVNQYVQRVAPRLFRVSSGQMECGRRLERLETSEVTGRWRVMAVMMVATGDGIKVQHSGQTQGVLWPCSRRHQLVDWMSGWAEKHKYLQYPGSWAEPQDTVDWPLSK